VRAHCWTPSTILVDLCSLFPQAEGLSNAAAAVAAAGTTGVLAPIQQAPVGSGDAVALLALLHVMAALPEAASSRQTNVHPDRRAAVSEALTASPWAAAVASVGLRLRNPVCIAVASKALHGFCELGRPPMGLDSQVGARMMRTSRRCLQHTRMAVCAVHQGRRCCTLAAADLRWALLPPGAPQGDSLEVLWAALLDESTAEAVADCLAALFSACK